MTADVDSSNIPHDIISAASLASPLTLGLYYNAGTKGCMRKCPCRVWAQCSHYNTAKWNESRGEEEVVWEEIHEYYENFFKYRPGLPDATYPNG